MPRTAIAALAMAFVASAGLAGCGGSSSTPEAADGPAAATAAPASPAPSPGAPEPSPTASPTGSAGKDAGQDAGQPRVPEKLRFTAPTVDGGRFAGADLAGRDAVLWFWAPWCPNCKREAPGVARVAEQHAGQVTFVGIAGRGEVPQMKGFVADGGVGGFPHVVDESGDLWTRFAVTYQPAYAFIDADGSVEVVTSSLGERELAERVRALASS